jgi:hypothetical protein
MIRTVESLRYTMSRDQRSGKPIIVKYRDPLQPTKHNRLSVSKARLVPVLVVDWILTINAGAIDKSTYRYVSGRSGCREVDYF